MKSLNRFGGSGVSEDEYKPLIDQPRVSKKRWVVLFASGLVFMTNSAAGIPLAVTNNILKGYYNVSTEVIHLSNNFYILTPPVMAILGTFILSQLGIRISLLITASLDVLGNCIRLGGLSRSGFTFVVVGQFVLSLGTIFALIASPQIASVWFPGNERTFATSIGITMNILGVAIGFLISTCMAADSGNDLEVQKSIRNLLATHTALCILFFVFALVLVMEEPDVHPSISQSIRKSSRNNNKVQAYLISVGDILSNNQYLMIGVAYSIHCVVVFSSSILLYQIIKQRPENRLHFYTQHTISWIGFFSSFVSIGGAFVSSYILDKNKEFKRISSFILMLTTMSSVFFAAAVYVTHNTYVLAASFTILMICSIPYCVSGLDHLADIAYPFPEGCSLMLPMIFVYGGFITAKYTMQVTVVEDHKFPIAVALTAMEAVALMLSFFASENSGRILTLSEEMDRGHLKANDL